jgi:beta-lactamase class A
MCSTFKWMLAAAILKEVDANRLALDRRIPYGAADVLSYSPVTEAQLAHGGMSVAVLAEAIVEVSDNAAANLLLKQIGGPEGLTRFLRGIGDDVTRLDRTEPALNSNLPDDPRDTTTPDAMAETMQKLLLGNVLSTGSRARLVGWMKDCKTGLTRLRAGFPKDWITADKTGTGTRGAVNDLAVTWPPGRAPIIVVAYFSGSTESEQVLSEAHAEIARIVAQTVA